MYIDAHAHLDDEAICAREAEVVAAARAAGVGVIVNASSDLPSSERSVALAAKYEEVYAVIGVHPHEAKTYSDEVEQRIITLAKQPKVVAFGEIGLDYHYDLSPRDVQQAVLEREIQLAAELALPVVFHVREAYEDFNRIIEKNRGYLGNGVLLHCYSGSAELAKYYRERFDAKFSFGGVLTFAKHKDVVLQAAGIENVMLETDCPYMTPVPYRGTPNEPKYIPLVAAKMAELYGVDVKLIENVTTENAKEFYRLERQ